jgi:hypothetical protein
MKILKIQTALFTKNLNISDDYAKSEILIEIKKDIAAIFDGNPNIIPIPNDAPAEIPRIILNSKNSSYSCNISLNRTDVFLNKQEEPNGDILDKQKENVSKIFNFIKNRGAIINRIGFVVFYEEENEDNINFIKSNYLKDGILDDLKELVIRYNKEETSLAEISNLNNIIEISALKNKKIINFFTDINTLAENMAEKNFDYANFEKIIDFAISANKKISSAFPAIK